MHRRAGQLRCGRCLKQSERHPPRSGCACRRAGGDADEIRGKGPDRIDHADIDAMHTAWFKAVTLTVALWSQPYDPTRW